MPLTSSQPPAPARSSCPQCGTELAPKLLVCPACHRLVHAEELKRLAVEAQQSEQANDLTNALSKWREAQELLPPDSRQYQSISDRIAALSGKVDAGASSSSGKSQPSPREAAAAKKTRLGKAWAWTVATLSILLTKFKLLLLGLTKLGTVWTMLLAFGVYWTIWGWKFAAGLVVSIYIHEMGHVYALSRFGMKATAPMFIPGFGALIRMKQHPASPREDARVGLAGPLWGLAAALAALAIYQLTGAHIWAAIARVGAWINLFNLIPIPPLDGGRGFRSLSRGQRLIVVAAMALMWAVTKEGLIVLLVIVAAWRALSEKTNVEPDQKGLLQYVMLVVALSATCLVPVPDMAQHDTSPQQQESQP
jgi:Zn-dependent protease